MKQRFREKPGQKRIMHQHRDINGQVFGKLHPLESKHSKKSTIQAHLFTVLQFKEE